MSKSSVLLINPWIADFAAYDLWAKPMGLLTVGKYLRHYGYDLQLIDLTDRARWGGEKLSENSSGRGKYHKTVIPKPPAVAHVPRQFGLYGATPGQFTAALSRIPPPKVIFVTSHMAYWYPGVLETIRVLRATFPESKIVLGGTYATLFPDHAQKTLEPDELITGYGEKASLIIADRIFGINRDYSNIPETLDNGLLPWDLYRKISVAALLTSRGCPMHCDYCATPFLNPRFTQRLPNDVINEIKYLYHEMNIREFAFYDDALFVNKRKHIIPILSGIIAENIKANFHTPNGLFAREIDRELAGLMKTSGFKTVRLSLESVAPEILRQSTGKVSTSKFERALIALEQAGFRRCQIETYLIMGIPGQNYEDVEKSIRFVYDCGAVSRLASYSPIPNTPLWETAKKAGFVHEDMDPLLTNNTLYPCSTPDFPVEKFAELRQLSNDYNATVRKK
ncbi:MAG: radical SAM protein [Candidatus Marinimicrobia bacterium]|nr:radical SAM protein [Candidatus Neomarinimicrobiota bacterium]